ncbi:MAG: lipid II flippase MurJ, partial [Patescibacteria group bacterium]
MITLALPRIFGMSVTQLSLMVDTIIASMLPIGSVTIINFASNLESLPIGLIGISVAVASFGVLSTLHSENNLAGFQKRVSDDLHRILGLIIPLAFGMVALRFPFVAWLLGHGKFDEHQTALTADTLFYFLIGLSFGGVVFLLARAFYSLKDTKTPVLVGIAAVVVNLSASIIFTKFFPLATLGLALANSLADIINASLLVILLQKRLQAKVIDCMEVGKFLLAAIIMVFVINATHSTSWPLTLQLLIPTLAGSASYIGICWVFRSRTLMNVL